MEILRKYVMGENPVCVQVLSDQSAHFGGPHRRFSRVNWEDPHYNVGACAEWGGGGEPRESGRHCVPCAELPLFTIHGNHDDPSREAMGGSGGEGGGATGESIREGGAPLALLPALPAHRRRRVSRSQRRGHPRRRQPRELLRGRGGCRRR